MVPIEMAILLSLFTCMGGYVLKDVINVVFGKEK